MSYSVEECLEDFLDYGVLKPSEVNKFECTDFTTGKTYIATITFEEVKD